MLHVFASNNACLNHSASCQILFQLGCNYLRFLIIVNFFLASMLLIESPKFDTSIKWSSGLRSSLLWSSCFCLQVRLTKFCGRWGLKTSERGFISCACVYVEDSMVALRTLLSVKNKSGSGALAAAGWPLDVCLGDFLVSSCIGTWGSEWRVKSIKRTCYDVPSSLDEVSLDICVWTALFVFLVLDLLESELVSVLFFSAAEAERVTVLFGGVARFWAVEGVSCEDIDVGVLCSGLFIGENGTGVNSFLRGVSLLCGDSNFLRSNRDALRAMSCPSNWPHRPTCVLQKFNCTASLGISNTLIRANYLLLQFGNAFLVKFNIVRSS